MEILSQIFGTNSRLSSFVLVSDLGSYPTLDNNFLGTVSGNISKTSSCLTQT